MRMIKMASKRAPQCCVNWYERHEETPLDVLEGFVNWTKVKHLKSYIEIGKLLGVTPNEANRLLCMAKLPDDVVICRMKEVMHNGK